MKFFLILLLILAGCSKNFSTNVDNKVPTIVYDGVCKDTGVYLCVDSILWKEKYCDGKCETVCSNEDMGDCSTTVQPPDSPFVTSSLEVYTKDLNLQISGDCLVGYQVKIFGDIEGIDLDTYNCTSGTFDFNILKNGDGQYNYHISHYDGVQNSPSVTVFHEIDNVPPNSVVINWPTFPYSSSTDITVNGSCEENAKVYLTGDLTNEILCENLMFSFNLTGLAGSYNYQIYQEDRAGNISIPVDISWNKYEVGQCINTTTVCDSSTNYEERINQTCDNGNCENPCTYILTENTCEPGTCENTGSAYCDASTNYEERIDQSCTNGNCSPSCTYILTGNTCEPGTCENTGSAYCDSSTNYEERINQQCSNGNCTETCSYVATGNSCEPGICENTGVAYCDASTNYEERVNQQCSNGNCTVTCSYVNTGNTCEPGICVNTGTPYCSVATNYEERVNQECSNGNCSQSCTYINTGNMCNPGTCEDTGSTYCGEETSYQEYINTECVGGICGSCLPRATGNSCYPTPNAPTVDENSFLTNTNSIIISGSCLNNHIVYLTGHDSQSQACASNSYSFTINKSVDSTYNFGVSQENIYGNNSSAVSISWQRDTVAPNTTINTGPAAILLLNQTANFTFSSNDGTATFECKLNSGAWTDCSSPHSVSGGLLGGFTLQIRAKDPAGNVDSTPASRSWTVILGL